MNPFISDAGLHGFKSINKLFLKTDLLLLNHNDE